MLAEILCSKGKPHKKGIIVFVAYSAKCISRSYSGHRIIIIIIEIIIILVIIIIKVLEITMKIIIIIVIIVIIVTRSHAPYGRFVSSVACGT
jgi:hypothetical protein